jgi:molybdenum cofactor cytidylyltransferase
MIDASDVVVVLLAAGQSTRFGEDNKLLAKLNDQPLVLHAARRIAELAPGRKIAVCSSAGQIADLLGSLGFEIIFNPDARSGLSSSLACAMTAVKDVEAAVLVCLGDMPFVSLDHLRALLARFDRDEAPIIASKAGEIAMPPALFASRYFDQLRTGQGDKGAKVLLSTAHCVFGSAEELTDIDTVEDLRRFTPSLASDPGTCPE